MVQVHSIQKLTLKKKPLIRTLLRSDIQKKIGALPSCLPEEIMDLKLTK